MARPTVCTNFWIFFEMFRKFLDLKNSFWQLEICFLVFPVVFRNSVTAAVFWYPDNYDRNNRKYFYFSRDHKYCETKKIQCRLNFLSLLSENGNIRYNFVKILKQKFRNCGISWKNSGQSQVTHNPVNHGQSKLDANITNRFLFLIDKKVAWVFQPITKRSNANLK